MFPGVKCGQHNFFMRTRRCGNNNRINCCILKDIIIVNSTMLDTMFENGLLAMKSGDHSIRFRGMLDTPKEAINKALEIVAKSIPGK